MNKDKNQMVPQMIWGTDADEKIAATTQISISRQSNGNRLMGDRGAGGT